MFYEVFPAKVFRQDGGILTYESEQSLQVGQVVLVPLGRAVVPGIVRRKVRKPQFKTKKIVQVLEEQPLPRHLLQVIEWMQEYYLALVPQVVNVLLPVGVAKKRRKQVKKVKKDHKTGDEVPLNAAQKRALQQLRAGGVGTQVLHGVTGSGKTNIYLHLAAEILEQGRSVILLVPEIALTSQLVEIFQRQFGERIRLLHSRQTEVERHRIWREILQATEPIMVIGPRSALWAPVRDLGLIIIDEAHETTYFQEQAPKYSAVRLAGKIAQSLRISCILGTATPLVTDYYLAKQKGSLVTLKEKAKKVAHPPQVEVVDLKNQALFNKNRYFSDKLLQVITENLEQRRQTLIFHNRRGSAPITVCEKCGWQALCPHCFLPMTLHADKYQLQCHTCGFRQTVPQLCPECQYPQIIHKGFGTKTLETELGKIFPQARVARFDTDNVKTETLDYRYSDVKAGEIDILVGTQTLTKGLDLPKLAAVGVVQADAGLALPDYAVDEHVFQLLTQVMGRVGRGHVQEARVVVQTYQPEHEVIKQAIKGDYEGFVQGLLERRRKQQLPPYVFLAQIEVTYKTEAATVRNIQKISRELRQQIDKQGFKVTMSQPMPAFHERTTQGYTWQIVLKARARQQLVQLLQMIPRTTAVRYTLDPPSML